MHRYIAVLLVLSMLGCGTPSSRQGAKKIDTPDKKGKIVTPVVSGSAAYWTALAKCVEQDQLNSTTTLVLAVKTLVEMKSLTNADVTKFDKAFPGITKEERPLTKDDASTLKGLAADGG